MNAKEWEKVAREALSAIRVFNAFYADLSKSNPGFMGKLALQDYAQWNKALLQSEDVLRRYKHIKSCVILKSISATT